MPQTIAKDLDVDASRFITSPNDLFTFLTAGRAVITLAETVTGTRVTYHVKVTRSRTQRGGHTPNHGTGPWTVYTRIGQEDHLLGEMRRDPDTGALRYWHNTHSRFNARSFQVRAFAQLPYSASAGRMWPANVRIWRAETCCRCGQLLYSEFRLIGFGPVCAPILGIDAPALLRARTEGERLELLREMLYRHRLTTQDRLLAQLTPTRQPVARDYANAVLGHHDAA